MNLPKMFLRLFLPVLHLIGLLLCTLYRTIRRSYKFHFYHLFIQLNPIKEIEQFGCSQESLWDTVATGRHRPSSHYNFFYLIPLSLSTLIMGDSLRIYVKASFNSSSPELERLYTHLIFPPQFYRLGDPMIWLAFTMTFAFSSCALVDPLLETKYVFYLKNNGNQSIISQGGKDLPPILSQKLVRYHRRMCTFIPCLFGIFVTVSQQFFLYFFVGYWTGSFHDYLVLFLILTFFFYGIFTNLIIIFYYLTVRCIRLKQNYLREEIGKLTGQLKGKLAGKASRKKQNRNATQTLALYRSFQQLQGQILALYEEIEGQNRFWSKYLTLYFAVYIPEVCIFSYGAFFLETGVLGFLFFIFFSVELTLILTLISYESSMVVYENIQLHKHCQSFLRLIQLSFPFKTRDLLKFNNLASSLVFIPSIGFKLINQQRINSKFFQMVVMYISITYMHMLEVLRK